MNKVIYFDNAASCEMPNEVKRAIKNCNDFYYANSSSIHLLGGKSKRILNESRNFFAKYFNTKPQSIIFTSGATEGNNFILKGLAFSNRIKRIITSKIEHSSIINVSEFLSGFGIEIIYLNVGEDGRVDFNRLNSINDSIPTLVSIAAVNNETGTIQDVKTISDICHRKGFLFHTDAVQALGNINLDWKLFDFITVTAHKMGGPKGIGLIVNNTDIELVPLLHGGNQEHGQRSGTENLTGVYAFTVAMKKKIKETSDNVKEIKKYIIDNLPTRVPCATFNCADGSPYILSISFNGYDADTIVSMFSERKICLSSGSACLQNSDSPSLALSTILKSERKASSTVRLSFSNHNTLEEAKIFVDTAPEVIASIDALK